MKRYEPNEKNGVKWFVWKNFNAQMVRRTEWMRASERACARGLRTTDKRRATKWIQWKRQMPVLCFTSRGHLLRMGMGLCYGSRPSRRCSELNNVDHVFCTDRLAEITTTIHRLSTIEYASKIRCLVRALIRSICEWQKLELCEPGRTQTHVRDAN